MQLQYINAHINLHKNGVQVCLCRIFVCEFCHARIFTRWLEIIMIIFGFMISVGFFFLPGCLCVGSHITGNIVAADIQNA